jgi:hypothetical protein
MSSDKKNCYQDSKNNNSDQFIQEKQKKRKDSSLLFEKFGFTAV